jgi:polar amino acid transport system permease protein
VELVLDSLPRLLDGLWITVQVTVLAALLGAVLAVLSGVGMLSERAVPRAAARTYVELFRGFPVLVLMFWFVFSVPQLLDFPASGLQRRLAILALALNIGAYEAEVVRGAIQAVPVGQTEASIALNFSPFQRMRRVIFPQAVPMMIPPWGNLTIQLLKASALVSLVSVRDVLFEGQIIINREGPAAAGPIFGGILVMYFVLAQLIAWFMRWAERKSSVGRQTGAVRAGGKPT